MKTRLDAELVRRELARSREHAADLIESRSVLVGGIPATKPATQVDAETSITIQGDRDDFVSRGGHKLDGALSAFSGVVVEGKRCLDAGASTGGFTDVLLRNLRDKFKDINFIGIRVIESGAGNAFIRRYCGYYGPEYDKTVTAWRKEKAISIKKSGYHTYFGLSSNALSQDSAFDVAEDATKSQIKTAFVKSLKTKKMNKRILGEFVELVA